MKINERIWFRLPLSDFIANTQWVLAKTNIGIESIVSLFYYQKQLPNMVRLSEDELKKKFIENVQRSLKKNNIDMKIEDCISIWGSFEVWLDIPKSEANTPGIDREVLLDELRELQADFEDLADSQLIELRQVMLSRINKCLSAINETDEDNLD